MPDNSAHHVISVVSACMTADGKPTFVLNTVEVTEEEEANGIHYYLAEAVALGSRLRAGARGPFR